MRVSIILSEASRFISPLTLMTLAGYDYLVLGLALLSVLIVVVWGKNSLTQIIIGSYLLIVLALGLYRTIDTTVLWLQSTAGQTGLFMLSHGTLADFLIQAKLAIVAFVTVFLGWQIMYGSSIGTLPNGTIVYRLWAALQIVLAAISVWIVSMVVWVGPTFFTTSLDLWADKIFTDPLIRQTVSRLPGILTAHVLMTILATTVFAAFIDISFRVGRAQRERDAIYVERDEPVRHVVE